MKYEAQKSRKNDTLFTQFPWRSWSFFYVLVFKGLEKRSKTMKCSNFILKNNKASPFLWQERRGYHSIYSITSHQFSNHFPKKLSYFNEKGKKRGFRFYYPSNSIQHSLNERHSILGKNLSEWKPNWTRISISHHNCILNWLK